MSRGRTAWFDAIAAMVIALLVTLGGVVAMNQRGRDERTVARAHATLSHPAQRTFVAKNAVGHAPLPGADEARAKLMFDAAMVAAHDGSFEKVWPDGSGRAVAVTATNDGAWVAVAEPLAPTPPPWPRIFIAIFLGAIIAMATAHTRFGGIAGAAFAIAATPIAIIVIAVVCLAIVVLRLTGISGQFGAAFRAYRVAYVFVAPTAIAMFVLVLAPFVIGLALGFFDYHNGSWSFVGLSNFTSILSGGGHPLNDPLNFWFILGVTILWTVANVVLHVSLGVALALLLSRTWIRGRGAWRMLFILPWAIPNYITALIWKGMFQGEYGAINSLLHVFGVDHVSWFASWSTAFSANVATNTWLGFPFMMVIAIGAIEGIPRDLYEAASIDGATPRQQFWHITMPHLVPAMAPAVALGSIWTFNMFNVIKLVSDGAPGGKTNILVTDAYRWAFERGERYGMAAAYATIIFIILLTWTSIAKRIAKRRSARSM